MIGCSRVTWLLRLAAPVALAVQVVGAPGCVFMPGDKARVAPTVTSPVHFAGGTASPDTGVDLWAQNVGDGTWTQFAAAVSQGNAVDIGGTSIYPWGTAPDPVVPLEAWIPGLRGFEARVRARLTADGTLLMATRENASDCWTSNGQSWPAFLGNCLAYDSVVTRIRTTDFVPFYLHGDASCEYGDESCNKCVPSVADTIQKHFGYRTKDRGHLEIEDLRGRSLPPTDTEPMYGSIAMHMQSMVRLPGLEGETWFALTHSSTKSGRGGLYFVNFGYPPGVDPSPFGPPPSTGEALLAPREGRGTNQVYYYRLPGPSHAGGASALGRLLFISMDCETSGECGTAGRSVRIYRVDDPRTLDVDHPLSEIFLDGSRGEAHQPAPSGGRTSSVAAARLADGRVVVFVAGNGSGIDYGWVYVTRHEGIDETTVWDLVQTVCTSLHHDDPSCRPDPTGINYFDKWYAAENMALVTQCGDGLLHLVRMGRNASDKFDGVAAYRLAEIPIDPDPGVWMYNSAIVGERITIERVLQTRGHGKVSLRWGGGLHVTPTGRLVTYVTTRLPNPGPVSSDAYEFRPR